MVKSHIIPESFFRDVDKAKTGLRVYSSKPDEFPKRSPTGVYDDEIVCEECEKKSDPMMSTQQRFYCRKNLNGKTLYDGERHLGYLIADGYELPEAQIILS